MLVEKDRRKVFVQVFSRGGTKTKEELFLEND
jgi:hypothetical protein